ncbi:MAG: hypothetical protein ABW003_16620 [Microvirga sp.]
MSRRDDVAKLFENLDLEADPLLDEVLASEDSTAAVAISSGLAVRLVSWTLGRALVSQDEAGMIATSLVTELHTLRQQLLFDQSAQS